jgi:hypothetical protein
VIRNGVDGVDHLEALIDIGELLDRRQVEKGELACLVMHRSCNNFNINLPKQQLLLFWHSATPFPIQTHPA